MRDRPAFHEVEPPMVVTSVIDGMTDKQWAAGNERRGARYSRVMATIAGVVVGFFFGILAVSRLDPEARHFWLAFGLVMGGSVLLFVTLFLTGRESEFELALWLVAPEMKALQSLPWWLTLILGLFAIAGTVLVAATILAGHLPSLFA